jgi:hypothetical protein
MTQRSADDPEHGRGSPSHRPRRSGNIPTNTGAREPSRLPKTMSGRALGDAKGASPASLKRLRRGCALRHVLGPVAAAAGVRAQYGARGEDLWSSAVAAGGVDVEGGLGLVEPAHHAAEAGGVLALGCLGGSLGQMFGVSQPNLVQATGEKQGSLGPRDHGDGFDRDQQASRQLDVGGRRACRGWVRHMSGVDRVQECEVVHVRVKDRGLHHIS